MSDAAFELPSGKDAGGENFPVASRLLSPRFRPHLLTFYAYCRAIDDVTDAPDVAADERRRRLGAFDAVVDGRTQRGPSKALALKRSLDETGVPATHARELIQAFILDTEKRRYADWGELMGYCRLSAAPVGRHVLDLHGEDRAAWPMNDALCAALQVLNHLQDCGDDYRELDRVYLPESWLAAEGEAVDVLGRPRASAALRRVLDRMLHATATLIDTARPLAGAVRDRRLAMEIGAIQALAEALHARLKRRDPLAERVKLGRAAMMRTALHGAGRALFAGRRASLAA